MADTFISKVFINNPQYLILDIPRKTATGTIAIQVEDFNDNCPTLTSTNQTVCFQDNVVYVTAVDGDAYPNGAPFEFKVVSNTKEEWSVERLNGEYLHQSHRQIIYYPGNELSNIFERKQTLLCLI